MITQPQSVIERTNPAAPKLAETVPATTLKTILVHIQDDSSLDQRVEAGLTLARAAGAHLSCLHVTPPQIYAATDHFGGIFAINDLTRALEEHAASLRARIEAKLGSEDVSWDYAQVTGDIATKVVAQAALADLVITGRTPHKDGVAAPATGLLGEMLLRSRTPLFIGGDKSAIVDPTGAAVIAWDGSHEAANAVRSALGLLRLAMSVSVVQVAERTERGFPGTRLLEYLSRQGVHAELTIARASANGHGRDAAAALVAHARRAGAAYMVMGGYSHSRLGEYVFGGVTRTLLKECPVSLVIAH